MSPALTLIPIPHPRTLRPGARIVRVFAVGEACYQEFEVLRWISPERPAAGQSWGSGFLRIRPVGQATGYLQVGPAKAVTKDFRLVAPEASPIPEFRAGPEDAINFDPPGDGRMPNKKSRSFWWNKDD